MNPVSNSYVKTSRNPPVPEDLKFLVECIERAPQGRKISCLATKAERLPPLFPRVLGETLVTIKVTTFPLAPNKVEIEVFRATKSEVRHTLYSVK